MAPSVPSKAEVITTASGFLLLSIGMMLIGVALYIIPYVFLNANYEIPGFVSVCHYMLYNNSQMSSNACLCCVFCGMVIIGLISIGIARLLVMFLEQNILKELAKPKKNEESTAVEIISVNEAISSGESVPLWQQPKEMTTQPWKVFLVLIVSTVLLLIFFLE